MKTSLAILIAILSLFYNACKAQKSFEKGYLVLISGDTVRGSINNRDWKINPKSIEFRSASGITTTYTPAEIKWFRLEESDEDFFAVAMTIDKSPVQPEHVTEESHLMSAHESVFLRVLLNGELKLLYYYDFKNHFFYEQDGEVTELLYPSRLLRAKNATDTDVSVLNQTLSDEYRKSGDILLLRRQEKYKFQLINLFADCKSMVPALQKLPYTEKAIKKVFLDYYKCKAMPRPSAKNSSKKLTAQLGLVAGFTQTSQTTTTGIASLVYLDAKRANVTAPSFGVSMFLALPRNREKFGIYTEVLFQQYELSTNHKISNSAYRTDFETNYHFKNINVMAGGRYHVLHSKVRPFISAGLSVAKSVQHDVFTIDKKTRHDATGPYEITRTDVPSRKSQVGSWASLGLTYQRASFEARFAKPSGWSNITDLKVEMSHLNFLFSFRLF
ncbi:MAG TPA: hypothetical protein VGD40_12135 [Chryseosolibacter sp.]